LIVHCAHELFHRTQKIEDEGENEDEDEVHGQGEPLAGSFQLEVGKQE